MTKKSILIVGAGGFIGGFIARKALEQGYDTWVGVRESTSRRYLDDPSLHFAVFDYDNPDAVKTRLQELVTEIGAAPTHIIWNLGATKCANFRDFDRINYGYVRTFVKAMQELNITPERFLYMSSLWTRTPYPSPTPATACRKSKPRPFLRPSPGSHG